MDGVSNKVSTANELLSTLGMKILRGKKVTLPPRYSSSWLNRMALNRGFAIEGGKAVLRSVEGEPILSAMKVGKGMVAVLTFSQVFTNPPMGGSYRVKPNQRQRDLYELEFTILRGLARDSLELQTPMPIRGTTRHEN